MTRLPVDSILTAARDLALAYPVGAFALLVLATALFASWAVKAL